jgi:hypothetical protein
VRDHHMKLGLFIGLLAVGLLTAAPALAAGPETSKIDFIYPKTFEGVSLAAQTDAMTPAATYSRLSIKLYGGYAHVLAGDVNDGTDYFFEIVDFYAAEGLGTVTGAYTPVHGGYDFGADIIYQLSPRIGVGVGVGYMRNSNNSIGTWTNDPDMVTLTSSATLTAMPIRLGLFYDAPLSKTLNLTLSAGAAYYASLKLEGAQGLEFSADEWQEMSLVGTQRSGADIGFHGSLGFEYLFSPKVGFFVEAVGRYAKFKNFEMVAGTVETSLGGAPETTEGKLYIYSENILGADISGFSIVEEGDTPDAGAREPKIDLTGFSLRAGFRIRF